MASWWRKALLGAATAALFAVAAVLDYLGYGLAALVALLTAIAAGGLTLALVMRRVGDVLAQSRSTTRLVEQVRRSSTDAATAHSEQLQSVSADVKTLGGQLELVTHAVKEGGAQSERMLQAMRRRLDQGLAELGDRTTKDKSDLLQELEALLRLRDEFPVTFESPLLWRSSLSPRGMWQVLTLVRERQPSTIVELGSGLSTLYLSRCVAEQPGSVVYSVEHAMQFLAGTRKLLEAHDATENVQLIHAPLVDTDIDGRKYSWYSVGDRLPATIDMLLVDGPPGTTGPLARLPALERLIDRLRPGAVIVLDDAHREEEREIVRSWVRDFDLRRHPSLTPRQAVLLHPGGS